MATITLIENDMNPDIVVQFEDRTTGNIISLFDSETYPFMKFGVKNAADPLFCLRGEKEGDGTAGIAVFSWFKKALRGLSPGLYSGETFIARDISGAQSVSSIDADNVLTYAAAHGMETGDEICLEALATSSDTSLDDLNNHCFTVTVVDATRLTLDECELNTAVTFSAGSAYSLANTQTSIKPVPFRVRRDFS